MAIDIRLPNITGKTEAEQLQQMKRYLYQLAEDLNYKLSTLEAGTSDETSVERNGTIDALKDWQHGVEENQAIIKSMASKGQAAISLIVKNEKVSGEVIIEAINDEAVMKISADRLDIVGKNLDIKVNATNIEGKVKAEQMEVSDLSALGATIGGFTVDHNSIHSAMKTANRILLCSGTSASYKVNGFTSTGWSILAGNKFGVLKDGTVYCEGAKINGSIETGVTSDDKQFGVKVGDGFIHVNSNAFKDIQSDGGQIYLLMKFNTEDGQTWGLFASGPYGEGGSIDLTDLFIERIDRLKAT